MIGIGWTDILIIAAVALIVVGPKDFPVLLRNLGRAMGAVRRMSNEFRREIDKAIAADEMREIGKSISDPLRKTSAEINREFHSIRNGKVEPSGRIKPADPQKESVVDEIRAQAGMEPRPPAAAPSVEPEAVRSARVVGAVAGAAVATVSAGEEKPARRPRRKPAAEAKATPKKTVARKRAPKSQESTSQESKSQAAKTRTRKPQPEDTGEQEA